MMNTPTRRAVDRLASIEELGGGGGGNSSTPSLVYMPGGAAGGNVYTTDTSLLAAIAELPGNKDVWVNDSIVSPAILNQPNMQLDGVTFYGTANFNNATGGAALEFGPNATVLLPTNGAAIQFTGWIQATYVGAGPMISITGATQEVNIGVGEISVLQSTNGLIVNAAAGFCWFILMDGALLGDQTHGVATASAAGAGVLVSAYANAEVGAHALSQSGGGSAEAFWEDHVPGAQGSGVTVTQAPDHGFLTVPLQGDPLRNACVPELQSGSINVSTGHALINTEYCCPLLVVTGTLSNNETLSGFPVSGGSGTGSGFWDVDLSGLNFNGHTLTFSAGGTTVSVTAAQLATTGQTGVRVAVVGTDNMTRIS